MKSSVSMVYKCLCFIFIVISFNFISCNRAEERAGNQSRTAALPEHFEGTYRGILPCADCRGIQTEIELRDDRTFTQKTVYLGTENHEVRVAEGTISGAAEDNHITLNEIQNNGRPVQYRVEENKLTLLTLEGEEISPGIADNYTLPKATNSLTDRYWLLVEINGQEVLAGGFHMREAHIIFYSQNNLAAGIGSCNSFSGHFELDEEQNIQFSRIASTKMFCGEGMDLENQYFNVLEQARNVEISGDTLTIISSDEAVLARFVPIGM